MCDEWRNFRHAENFISVSTLDAFDEMGLAGLLTPVSPSVRSVENAAARHPEARAAILSLLALTCRRVIRHMSLASAVEEHYTSSRHSILSHLRCHASTHGTRWETCPRI